MGVWGGVKRATKPLVDVPSWIGADTLSHSSRLIKDLFTRYLIPRKPEATRAETFVEAKQRLGLTIDDLYRTQRALFVMAMLTAVLVLADLAYITYLICNGHWHAMLLACVILGISGSLFFRYHFWWFQIKSRKLGCTLREWFFQGVLRRRS